MLIDRYASRAAWLSARKGTIGGSAAPVILGLSPYKTPLALWSEYVGILPPTDGTDQRMRIGHHVEGAILGLLAEEAGVYVEPERFAIVRHPLFPELTYSPDGWVGKHSSDFAMSLAEDGTALGIAEVKNRAGFDAAADWSEEIPRDVYAQVQHGLDVTGLPAAWVGVLLQGREFRWAKVPRDDVWIEEKRPLLLDFARRVRDEDAPPATGSAEDKAALEARWPIASGPPILAMPPEAIDLAQQYKEAAETAKVALAAKDVAGNKLREMLGDAETGWLPSDLGKVTWKVQARKAYQVEASVSRVLRVALKKDGD